MKFKERIVNLKTRFEYIIEYIIERPILTSSIVLAILTMVVLGLSLPYYLENFKGFAGQILGEAHGMLFDIAVIGILIFWLNKNGEKRQRIRTYKDEIDDFRLWESEEAAFRTVGNIKRLNRHEIHEINLVNCHLSKTNLNYVNLKDSNLNSADLNNSFLIETNLSNTRLNQTNLENSNLNQANMTGAYANGANFKDAYLIKTNLQGAFLIKTNFVNAFLMEADLRGSYVTGADFDDASLYKADLREVKGLTIDQLRKAKTLYLARFDEEVMIQLKTETPELVGE